MSPIKVSEFANIVDSFWENAEVMEEDDCWLWIGTLSSNGYGRWRLNGREIGAHRFAFAISEDRNPFSLNLICHTCDNKACVNALHLFEGTPRDNVMDSVSKGRWQPCRRGENSNFSKLTLDNVIQIRALARIPGKTHQQLAKQFGISRPGITRIINRDTWAWA